MAHALRGGRGGPRHALPSPRPRRRARRRRLAFGMRRRSHGVRGQEPRRDRSAHECRRRGSCADTARVVCGKLETCAPLALRLAYDETPTCEQDVVGACRARYRGAEASPQPAVCDVSAISCERVESLLVDLVTDAWFGPVLLGVCPVTPGKRAIGAGCEGDDVSTRCKDNVCVARSITEGEPCGAATAGCDLSLGLVCSAAATRRRARLATTGQACRTAFADRAGRRSARSDSDREMRGATTA